MKVIKNVDGKMGCFYVVRYASNTMEGTRTYTMKGFNTSKHYKDIYLDVVNDAGNVKYVDVQLDRFV